MTNRDLGRSLQTAARAPIATALARQANRAAAMLAAAAPEAGTVIGRQDGAALVTLVGPGLFAREFGAIDSAADPVIAPAIRKLRRRMA